MSCLSSARRASITARLVIKNGQLTAAYGLLDQLLADPNQMYRLDTGEGMQQASHKKLNDVEKMISTLESEINRLETKLAGKGIVNMNLRRGSWRH